MIFQQLASLKTTRAKTTCRRTWSARCSAWTCSTGFSSLRFGECAFPAESLEWSCTGLAFGARFSTHFSSTFLVAGVSSCMPVCHCCVHAVPSGSTDPKEEKHCRICDSVVKASKCVAKSVLGALSWHGRTAIRTFDHMTVVLFCRISCIVLLDQEGPVKHSHTRNIPTNL